MKVPSRPEWQADAACRNVSVEVMVGARRTDDSYSTPTAMAKRYCQRCPVVVECLDEAMRNPQLLGVWGGLTTSERKDRRNRRTAA